MGIMRVVSSRARSVVDVRPMQARSHGDGEHARHGMLLLQEGSVLPSSKAQVELDRRVRQCCITVINM